MSEAERAAAVERISPAPAMEDLASCDLVIAAATENEAISGRSTQAFARPQSGSDDRHQHLLISITRLASSTDRPERFSSASTS